MDRLCNQRASPTVSYRFTDPAKPGLQPYDRTRTRPTTSRRTTTDQGVTVPFVVRREDGFADRDRYTIITLFQPGERWSPYAPQESSTTRSS